MKRMVGVVVGVLVVSVALGLLMVLWVADDRDVAESTPEAHAADVVGETRVDDEVVERFGALPLCDELGAISDEPGADEVVMSAITERDGCLAVTLVVVQVDEAERHSEALLANPATLSVAIEDSVVVEMAPSVGAQADPLAGEQWAVDRLDLREAWNWSRGEGVRVGMVDSEVEEDHEDLAANVGLAHVFDDNRPDHHGTHVAGTIAAIADNGLGVVGVAPEATLISSSYWADSVATEVGVAIGIRKVVDADIGVLNLSIGLHSEHMDGAGHLELAIRHAVERDVVVVMAAGNCGAAVDPNDRCPQGMSTIYRPQAFTYLGEQWSRSLMTVGASTEEDRLAGFSSYTRPPSLVAPGVDIMSTSVEANGRYSLDSGTSMAAPHVAGVAALVRAAAPEMSAPEVIELLVATAEPLEQVVPDSAGAGLIDPVAALESAVGSHADDGPGLRRDGLSLEGIDPLRFGASISEAEALVGGQTTGLCGLPVGELGILSPHEGLGLIFEDGRFTQYQVSERGYRTQDGLGVGSSLDEAIALIEGLRRHDQISVALIGSEPTNVVLSLTPGRGNDPEQVSKISVAAEPNIYPPSGLC